MRIVRRPSRFKRDVERMQPQGRDLEKLKKVIETWVKGERLAQRCRDHVLVGQYQGTRVCHIEPTWLLIYELAEDGIVLIRTGSHSDLFK